jgi:hypothetical protein
MRKAIPALVALLAAALLAFPARADEPPPFTPVQAGLLWWQLPSDLHAVGGVRLYLGSAGSRSVSGVDLGIGHGRVTDNVTGVQLSLGLNTVGGRMHGIQVAPLGNYVDGGVRGIQFGAANFSGGLNRPVVGLQLGLVNRSWATVTGVQAGLWNDISGLRDGGEGTAGTIYGVQAGLFNFADRVSGFQIGLVNGCRELRGLQVGLLNMAWQSRVAVLPIVNAGF